MLEQVAEKAKSSDLLTLNKALDTILPLVSTSLSYTELLKIAAGAGSFSIGETEGFPFEKTTAELAAGDCVIPIDLASNVSALHEFLYGTSGYQPSAAVVHISDTIAAATGIYG